jgi:hypothetical protein
VEAEEIGTRVMKRTEATFDDLDYVGVFVVRAIKNNDLELLRAYDDCYSGKHRLADIDHAVELLRYHQVDIRLTKAHLDAYDLMSAMLLGYATMIQKKGSYLKSDHQSGLKFLALTQPEHVDTFMTLISERDLTDPEGLAALAEDMRSGSSHLNDGKL